MELSESGGGMRRVGAYICGLILLVNLMYVITGVARLGPQHIDAYGIWMLKAKAIGLERGIPIKLLSNSEYSYSHQQYPLLLPWLMSWTDSWQWGYPVGYGLVLGMIYLLLRQERLSRVTSLAWTTTASFMGPLVAQGGRGHVGLADIWICLAVAVAFWATRKKYSWIVVMMVMIASQIKTEGIFLVVFLIFSKEEWKRKLAQLSIAIFPFMMWNYSLSGWGIGSDIGLRWYAPVEIWQRGVRLIGIVAGEMLNWRNWYVIWPIFWLRYKRVRELEMMVLLYAGVYIFSTLPVEAYASSSVDRIMLQLMPLWWVGMAGKKPDLKR